MPVISLEGDLVSGSEVSFISKDEENYPQLTRLFLDFGFRVLAVPSPGDNVDTRYLITFGDMTSSAQRSAVTPAFPSLSELEAYTDEHIIDILHGTLSSQYDDEA